MYCTPAKVFCKVLLGFNISFWCKRKRVKKKHLCHPWDMCLHPSLFSFHFSLAPFCVTCVSLILYGIVFFFACATAAIHPTTVLFSFKTSVSLTQLVCNYLNQHLNRGANLYVTCEPKIISKLICLSSRQLKIFVSAEGKKNEKKKKKKEFLCRIFRLNIDDFSHQFSS